MVRGTQLKGAAYTYTIEKILGQGTFGITYLATSKVQIDGALGALETTLTVAIKEFFMHDLNGRRGNEVTCSSQGGIYEHYRRKFAREAQNLSKLSHPNIVRVLESFEANNTVYYAMEFCEGGSLDELIAAQGGLSEAVALDYARQIGSALDYMHSEKVLHLDLKPGNVMLRKNGSVALIDFGLSKQYDEEGAPESSTTIGGGTPGYAPIEQANYREGGQFAAAIDVYALGATLFKMLTGERPAEASVLLNEGFPAEKLTAKGVSERTIAVVAKAMEGLKRNRYATVAEFLKALDGTAATPPVAPAPEEKTVYNDPAAEATVIDEAPKPASAPKPAPAPQPKPQPAPVPTPPKKKGSNMWLWILLLLLLIVGGLVVSRIITKPMAEQAVIEEAVEEQPAIEYSDSMGFAATAPQQTDADRLAQEKAAEERRLAKEKAAKEKAKKERLAAEKAAKEKAEKERLAAEKAAKEKAEKERLAAEQAKEEIIDDEPFLISETMPSFQGGDLNKFRNWLASRVRHPQIALENGIQGRVVARFVIEKDGSLTNIQILQSPDYSLSEEVIRVLNQSPKWSPGKQRDRVVRVTFTIPVDFRIQK